jgi:hypothetical protein
MAPELTISRFSSTSCTEEKPIFTRIESTVFYEQQKFYRSRVSQRDPEALKSTTSSSHLYSAGHHPNPHNNNSNHHHFIIEEVWVSWEA